MECPKCSQPLRISNSYFDVANDTTPDLETQLFTVLEHSCLNPSCELFNKIVKTSRNVQKIGKESGEVVEEVIEKTSTEN